jgi:hypothetical protein
MFIKYRYVAMFYHHWYTDQRRVEVGHNVHFASPSPKIVLESHFLCGHYLQFVRSHDEYFPGREAGVVEAIHILFCAGTQGASLSKMPDWFATFCFHFLVILFLVV